MDATTKEDRVRDLKSLRAELLALKEKMDSEDADGEETRSALAALRKSYFKEFSEENVETSSIDEAKKGVWTQYESCEESDEEDAENKHIRVLRR